MRLNKDDLIGLNNFTKDRKVDEADKLTSHKIATAWAAASAIDEIVSSTKKDLAESIIKTDSY
eukprot:1149623-Heterocapsa_arctica.AAC.1